MSLRSRLRALFTMGQGVARGLPDAAANDDPLALFRRWFEAARQSGLLLPEAMCLATATPDGKPSARMMLLKGADERGFVFFTNYDSRKGAELAANAPAALVLHWAVLERQVRVEGVVERLGSDESFAYFRTRSRGSRIGAWASAQSRPLAARADLEAKVRETERRFPGDDVPLPPFWGGFRLIPERIEFWQGRVNRLHDRLVFERTRDGGWAAARLYP
jgi:pyridoxamine 5'-phosphate oxidase